MKASVSVIRSPAFAPGRRIWRAPVRMWLAPVLFALVSCATVDPFIPVDHLADDEQFLQSAAVLEEKNKTIYREKDRVLYFLDKGMLTHHGGAWEESSALLEQGEKAIEANFAVSVSQEIGVLLLNDRTREYDGEDYEDLYLNVFNALNYYHRNNLEEALVEIRRMNNKLRDLSVKYGTMMTGMQKLALENGTEIPPNPEAPSAFNNSALARYLGILFYRGAGMMDDARIDERGLRTAMADAPSVYPNPVPASVKDELAIPPGMARLNALGFTGRAPVKTEETLRIFLGNAWIKIALPVMTARPSRITSVEAVLDSGESFTLELLEDMGAVAAAAFTRKKNLIYTRSVIRASVKGIAASAFNVAADNSTENSGLYALLGLGSQILAEASERADLRSSRYFPGQAYVGGINLPPGEYSFTLTFYGPGKTVIARRRHEKVNVRANALNLTEDICLR
ncbi:MAG: hypothetical protein LBD09_02745 [Treponema sp.]|jgi:hypothetical protein|nr:hypothetical protein [Treponema sp.]